MLLANERTFLAWIRTSLSLITVGVAISQLYRLPGSVPPSAQLAVGDPSASVMAVSPIDSFHLPSTGKALGGTFIAIGILYVLLACWRYFRSQHAMTHGMFPTSRVLVVFGALLVLLLLISLMVVVLMERSGA